MRFMIFRAIWQACIPIAFALLVSSCVTSSSEPYTLSTGPGLAMKVVQPRGGGPVETLVVLLHGDVSRGGPADYMYSLASQIARSGTNIAAAAIIRPGYYDSEGNRSPGDNNGRRDNATRASNSAIANEIRRLRATFNAKHVVAMGHSAGAIAVGAIIARAPGLIDAAILVSCPCDIQRWRSMNDRRPRAIQSESPSKFVDLIPATTKVVAVTGSRDDNTYPSLAIKYVASLQSRGLDARFVEVSGAGHGFRGLRETVRKEILEAAKM